MFEMISGLQPLPSPIKYLGGNIKGENLEFHGK
jgi:hypothetical protein